ncbi:MAG: type VI secretion system tube protein Hcp [Verrucomicrobiota bacterium]
MNSIAIGSGASRPSGNSISRHCGFRAVIAIGIACFSALLFIPTGAFAQPAKMESFLDLDGIKGGSTVDGHKGQIDILGFGSGVELATTLGGGGTGKPQFYEITVSKNVDKASPLLFVNCATGKIFATATLTMARVTPSGVQDFFKIELTNVKISRAQSEGLAGNSGNVAEEIALSFEKIRWTVTIINSKGQPVVTTGGYDLGSGQPL